MDFGLGADCAFNKHTSITYMKYTLYLRERVWVRVSVCAMWHESTVDSVDYNNLYIQPRCYHTQFSFLIGLRIIIILLLFHVCG